MPYTKCNTCRGQGSIIVLFAVSALIYISLIVKKKVNIILNGDVGFNYNISEFYHAWIKMSIWIKDKIEKNEKSQHGKFLKHLQSFSDEDFTLL